MPENKRFLPEGLRPSIPLTLPDLREAAERGDILEATVQRCDAGHTLHLDLNGVPGRIPRPEAIAPWINGATRDIAVLSRVGKTVCFQVLELKADEKGAPLAILSRRTAQGAGMASFLEYLEPGMVLTCRVTRLESYGAFVDIGCGIIAILPIELMSVSRIAHPNQRVREGQCGSCWVPGWRTPAISPQGRRCGAPSAA